MRIHFINMVLISLIFAGNTAAICAGHEKGHGGHQNSGFSSAPPPSGHPNQPHGTMNTGNQGMNGSWHHGEEHHENHHNQIFLYSYPYYPYYPYYPTPYYAPATDYYSYPSDYSGYNSGYAPDNSGYTNAAENNIPSGTWVAASNGSVPEYAIPFSQTNGNTTYYCRAQYNNQMYYGTLIANDGCYIDDTANAVSMRFDNYQVLVQP